MADWGMVKLELILNQIESSYVDSVNVEDFYWKNTSYNGGIGSALRYLSSGRNCVRPMTRELRGMNIEKLAVFKCAPGCGYGDQCGCRRSFWKMGLQPGDKIIKVDTQRLQEGLPQDSIVSLWKVPKGQKWMSGQNVTENRIPYVFP